MKNQYSESINGDTYIFEARRIRVDPYLIDALGKSQDEQAIRAKENIISKPKAHEGHFDEKISNIGTNILPFWILLFILRFLLTFELESIKNAE